jgi:hypothetical protein
VNELEFQRQFKADGPPTLGDVFARALLPDRAELEEARAAKAAADALAARNEELALANAMAGDPLAELSRAQTATAAARDVVRDLEARLSEARETLSRAEGNMAAWGGQVDEVMTQVARRSEAEVDLLAPAKAAHQEFAAATRAAIAAMEAGTPRRASRPFVSRGAGEPDPPVDCPECAEAGCTWEESVLIHHDSDLARDPDPDHAERRRARGYAEIRR